MSALICIPNMTTLACMVAEVSLTKILGDGRKDGLMEGRIVRSFSKLGYDERGKRKYRIMQI